MVILDNNSQNDNSQSDKEVDEEMSIIESNLDNLGKELGSPNEKPNTNAVQDKGDKKRPLFSFRSPKQPADAAGNPQTAAIPQDNAPVTETPPKETQGLSADSTPNLTNPASTPPSTINNAPQQNTPQQQPVNNTLATNPPVQTQDAAVQQVKAPPPLQVSAPENTVPVQPIVPTTFPPNTVNPASNNTGNNSESNSNNDVNNDGINDTLVAIENKINFLYDNFDSEIKEIKAMLSGSTQQVTGNIRTREVSMHISDFSSKVESRFNNLEEGLAEFAGQMQDAAFISKQGSDKITGSIKQLVSIYRQELELFRAQNEYLKKALDEINSKLKASKKK